MERRSTKTSQSESFLQGKNMRNETANSNIKSPLLPEPIVQREELS